jgi:hypothetical protein
MAAQIPHRRLVRWLIGGLLLLAAALAIAAADAMLCDQYAKFSRLEGAAPPAPVFQEAKLLEGTLCTEPAQCSPATLVRGIMSPHTVEEIYARAAIAMPGNLWVCFQSPGGSHALAAVAPLPDNVKTCVADVVDREGRRTAGLCASACSWVWLAGRDRALIGANTVGFHRPYLYDAPVCTPGNLFQGAVSVAMGFVRDRFEPAYDEREQSVRHALRMRGMSRAPTEVYELRRDEAMEWGLVSPGMAPAAFFRVGQGGDQAVAVR